MPSSTHDPAVLRRLTMRLRDASPTEWATIANALAPLRGPAVSDLWRRARHRALWFRSAWPNMVPGVFEGLFALGELRREFNPVTQRQLLARAKARGPGHLDPEYHAAFIELWELAAARTEGDATTTEAVVLAGALASRPTVDDESLKRAWAPLESVVPLAFVRLPSRPAA